MVRRRNQPLCAICGLRPAKTADHIPPKGIFAKPLPTNLITVPACFSCNNTGSKNDERFRLYLSMHVGIDTPQTKALWDKHAFRSIMHNKHLHREILQTMKPIDMVTPNGIFLGKRTALLWDSQSHDSIIEKMIRGLYFHHYPEIIGGQTKIKVHWLKHLRKDLSDDIKHWPQNNIGNGAFIYKYIRDENNPPHSVWVFQFYGKHWASGYTEPV